jgi:hypothetical protein
MSSETSRSAGLNDHIQPLGERAKRQRGATKERIFLSQLRQFREKADDRLAVR